MKNQFFTASSHLTRLWWPTAAVKNCHEIHTQLFLSSHGRQSSSPEGNRGNIKKIRRMLCVLSLAGISRIDFVFWLVGPVRSHPTKTRYSIYKQFDIIFLFCVTHFFSMIFLLSHCYCSRLFLDCSRVVLCFVYFDFKRSLSLFSRLQTFWDAERGRMCVDLIFQVQLFSSTQSRWWFSLSVYS